MSAQKGHGGPPLSHEVVLQNYDIIDVWLSVFSYAITLELLNLLLCLLA